MSTDLKVNEVEGENIWRSEYTEVNKNLEIF
jgi:hypothetical protein